MAETKQDLLCASLAVLVDVANDAKRADQEIMYSKVLSSVLTSMEVWSETRLLDYHERFHKGAVGLMENLLPFALSVAKILDEDISNLERGDRVEDSAGSRVDYFIKSSMRNAFSKMLEIGGNSKIVEAEDEESSEGILQLSKETEELASKEKENFSPILNRWHPIVAGVAAMTLHNCY
ncbi:hypothetical protein GIB67_009143 [Kingdonia uniflora]|uniref:Uncharacterized protein n=1 Tax=Kingdonia uniflora TaxID=39325 RepID=A0A7J7N2A5_9MAGN|nr:hypothetical protein GIB67_009143 [Kingdonia uniflora]